jgi:hypothetical protein
MVAIFMAPPPKAKGKNARGVRAPKSPKKPKAPASPSGEAEAA